MTSQQRKEYEVKSLTWETQKMESRTSHPNPTRARQGAFLQNVHGHALVHSVFYVIRCEHGVIQPLTETLLDKNVLNRRSAGPAYRHRA